MSYDITTHGDFKRYYSKGAKQHIWVLGYFGGSISDAMEVAKQYAEENNVPVETVMLGEINTSRRFKYFKYIYSPQEHEISDKVEKTNIMDNPWVWLND